LDHRAAKIDDERARREEMVYRGGCVAEYLERSPSTYDEQIGVA
jgi:hypothetical protein